MHELLHYDNAAKEFYDAQKIKSLPINSWDYYSEHFEGILKSSKNILMLNKLAADHNWRTALKIEEELLQKKHVVIVTDAHLSIVFASHNMTSMNGYASEEVIGKTPKIFQGKETCAKTNLYISNAIKSKKAFEATVLNYRKDGSTYKCWIKAEPVLNNEKEVVHFIAYEKEVA